MSKACKHTSFSFLFADDSNISALSCTITNIKSDLIKLNNWLNANKFVLNIDKNVQINIGNSASNQFKMENFTLKTEPLCKYMGILIDPKLSFQDQIQLVSKETGS